ncbi:8085_t:CDS:2, partial [Scutellospora calospora]
RRFEIDTANPKKILNSLLERHHSKIVLDKVLVKSKEKFMNATLKTEEEEIKEEKRVIQTGHGRNHKKRIE